MKVYKKFAEHLATKKNLLHRLDQLDPSCQEADEKWKMIEFHNNQIKNLIDGYLPSGAGLDMGVSLDDSSHEDRLVFQANFHHMDEHGYYDGWSDHKVIITPTFIGDFNIRVTGRNVNNIKDHIADTFYHCLSIEV